MIDSPDNPRSGTPSLYEWVGGIEALSKMTARFYGTHVPADPILAPVFAGMEPDHHERVAAWLAEVFGGPDLYSQRWDGYASMVAAHLNRYLTEEQRARWVALLVQSANEVGVPNDAEFRAAFVSYLEWGSRIAVENSADGATPPAGMPVPTWTWVNNAVPGARQSALDPVGAEADATTDDALTDADLASLSFATHIQPLFRERDRASMNYRFDLWSHDDVSQYADAILGRVRSGSMPCDGAWPANKVERFAAWIDAGCPA